MSRDKAIVMLGYFIGLIGGCYHPDNAMTEYVSRGGKASFSKDQAEKMQTMHDEMFSVLGDDCYTLALTLCQELI